MAINLQNDPVTIKLNNMAENLEEGVRQRLIKSNVVESREDLPYGGKVYLARRKKPDPWWVTGLEVRSS